MGRGLGPADRFPLLTSRLRELGLMQRRGTIKTSLNFDLLKWTGRCHNSSTFIKLLYVFPKPFSSTESLRKNVRFPKTFTHVCLHHDDLRRLSLTRTLHHEDFRRLSLTGTLHGDDFRRLSLMFSSITTISEAFQRCYDDRS